MAAFKILIVEDEPVHLNVMKTKLERSGYEVLAAQDGEAGYALMKGEKPSLVLLDIILPKMDGFQFLERAKKEGVATPIIVVSNSGQPVEVDKALKLGAKDFLVKAEFNPEDVFEKVEKILGVSVQKKVDGDASSDSAKKSMVNREGKKIKILAIEDDKFLRDLMVQKLRKEGFLPLEALDGEEGLKQALEQQPDLVLLDLILPGLDGFEVLHRMKADEKTRSIPIIVLSNLGQKEDMDRALASGAEDFMIKANFTPGEIIAKIKSILQKKYF